MENFELPRDCNMDLVKRKTPSNLGLSFRNLKSRMWSQNGQKNKMPDWDKYLLLKPYWSGFKKYKQSEEATKISQENKMNTKKKVIHHTTGSHGYAGKKKLGKSKKKKQSNQVLHLRQLSRLNEARDSYWVMGLS
jgi:hypothetical protein